MENTLELKHLAPYLPYVLKGISQNSYYTGEIESVTGLTESEVLTNVDALEYEDFKPILRPLSDLTKAIEIDGEKFVPISRLEDKSIVGRHDLKIIQFDMFPYRAFEYFFKWHFDVFGLIDKGLAIDINTLNK